MVNIMDMTNVDRLLRIAAIMAEVYYSLSLFKKAVLNFVATNHLRRQIIAIVIDDTWVRHIPHICGQRF
jgi:hypothetical protein